MPHKALHHATQSSPSCHTKLSIMPHKALHHATQSSRRVAVVQSIHRPFGAVVQVGNIRQLSGKEHVLGQGPISQSEEKRGSSVGAKCGGR
eukprot:349948-Chlamydomonas_euryale.AAC.1